MATPLLLWLFNEASSGTTPTAAVDTSTGSPNNLAITYGTGSWTSNSGGDGLNFNGACGAVSPTLASSKVSTGLGGLKTATLEVVTNLTIADPGHNQTWFSLGGGGRTEMSFVNHVGLLRLVFADNVVVDASLAVTGLHVYHFVIDTAQATAANRIKFYINGALQTLTGASFPAQNTAFVASGSANWANYVTSVGCSQVVNSDPIESGAVFYTALYASVLDATTCAAHSTSLLANNDANPNTTNAAPNTFFFGPGV